MDIWIVEQSSGSYDDFMTWPVCAFESKVEAEKWILMNNALLPAKFEKEKEEAKEFESRYNELLEKYDLKDWDDHNPNFRKWRDELDVLTSEWVNVGKAMDFEHVNPYNIGNQIKLTLRS